MSSNIVANVTVTRDLTWSGPLVIPNFSSNSTSYFYLPLNVTTTLYATPLFYGKVALGLSSTTQELDLSTDFARKSTTSTWATGSDIRIKTNIETANLVRCAEIVDTLELKHFEWKKPTFDQTSLGWIAQDVQSFFPKSVFQDSDGNLMLDSDQLIKVLYGALKQTQLEFFPT